MADVNITKVRLLRVPLENDYKHTLYFTSRDEQRVYFESLPWKTFDDFSYQRKDGTVRVPISFDEALQYNYVMYQNNNSSKWFYAFITNHEYKGEDQTNLTIETDVMQTWLIDKDYVIKPSFIDREHVDDDSYGLHTVAENLETGDYVCNFTSKISELQDTEICMAVTKIILYADQYGENKNYELLGICDYMMGGKVYNGVYSGLFYNAYNFDEIGTLNKHIEMYSKGYAEEIKTIFVVPSIFTKDTYAVDYINIEEAAIKYGVDGGVKCYTPSEKPIEIEFSIQKTVYQANNRYTPKNNKANCFPYRYILVSNNAGGSAVYKYERFKNNMIDFKVRCVLTPGCSIRLIPMDYNGEEGANEEEGLNLGKYPICNWTSDEYTNWLTQNGTNIALNYVSGAIQVVGGVAMSVGTSGLGATVGTGMIASGVATIAGQLAQSTQASYTPNQSKGNINCGDVITASHNNTFTFYGMTAKDENIRIIDEYFSMFGYKCNRVKVPNKDHRKNYWFTKTIDVNINSSIVPLTDLAKIKNCYNNGITFWIRATNIKDYTVDNSIV